MYIYIYIHGTTVYIYIATFVDEPADGDVASHPLLSGFPMPPALDAYQAHATIHTYIHAKYTCV